MSERNLRRQLARLRKQLREALGELDMALDGRAKFVRNALDLAADLTRCRQENGRLRERSGELAGQVQRLKETNQFLGEAFEQSMRLNCIIHSKRMAAEKLLKLAWDENSRLRERLANIVSPPF